MKKIEYNEDWKYTPVTEGQMKYIAKMREFSDFPLPKFDGKTQGEAVAYIEKYRKIAHTRSVSADEEQ